MRSIIMVAIAAFSAGAIVDARGQQQDYCARPDVIAFLLRGLHNTQGFADADLRDMSTVPIKGFDIDPTLGSAAPFFVCHLTVVKGNGSLMTGRMVVGENFRSLNWTSDADYQKRAAASAAQSKQYNENQLAQERSERGILAQCDPQIKAQYDEAIHQLSSEIAAYWQTPNEDESAQDFSAYADVQRQVMTLRAERLKACSH